MVAPDTTEAAATALVEWVAADFPPDDVEMEQVREGVRSILAADRADLQRQGFAIVEVGEVPPWMEQSHWAFEGEQGAGPAQPGETPLYRLSESLDSRGVTHAYVVEGRFPCCGRTYAEVGAGDLMAITAEAPVTCQGNAES